MRRGRRSLLVLATVVAAVTTVAVRAPASAAAVPDRWLQISTVSQDQAAGTTCAVRSDRSMWCWGTNEYGQFGNGEQGPEHGPEDDWVPIGQPSPVRGAPGRWLSLALYPGGRTCAVREDHTLWCWGRGFNVAVIELSQGIASPFRIGAGEDWARVFGSADHETCAQKLDGTAWCWRLVRDSDDGSVRLFGPVRQGEQAWLDAAGGDEGMCGVLVDTTLWCSNADPFDQPSLHPVGQGSGWSRLTPGGCGLREGGLYCSGSPVGVGDTLRPMEPVGPAGETGWRDVADDGFHGCAVRASGRLFCFGHLGDGSSILPAVIDPDPDHAYASVSANARNACGIREDGSAWCWGVNGSGELGDGRRYQFTDTPVAVQQTGDAGESLDATPSVSVSGSTVHLHATDLHGGANQFTWTVTRTSDQSFAGETSGIEAELDLPPGEYTVSLDTCVVAPPLFQCLVSRTEAVVPLAAQFDVITPSDASMRRRLVARQPALPTMTYRWFVDGKELSAHGPSVEWTPRRAGRYDVRLLVGLHGLTSTDSRSVTVGLRLEVARRGRGTALTGTVADPTVTCDDKATVLTATSSVGVWTTVETSPQGSLQQSPLPQGALTILGLVPPGGSATWVGGCFDRAEQEFRVAFDVDSQRALAATALSGFLGTITGGQLDAAAEARAISVWEDVAAAPLTHSRAAVRELQRVLVGKGSMERAAGEMYAALTQEPEATRLRNFVFGIAGAVPVLNDFAAIAEAITTWTLDGFDPYAFGRTLTSSAVEHQEDRLDREIIDAEQDLAVTARKQARHQALLDRRRAERRGRQAELDAAAAELESLTCLHGPAGRACRQQARALQDVIDRATREITALTGSIEKIDNYLARLAERAAHTARRAAALRNAVKHLAIIGVVIARFWDVSELAVLVAGNHSNGSITYTAKRT